MTETQSSVRAESPTPASPASAPLGEGTTPERCPACDGAWIFSSADYGIALCFNGHGWSAASAPPEGVEEVIDGELLDTAECTAYPNEGRCTHTRCLLRERNKLWADLATLTARLREREGERDEANKTVGVMSADFSRFHREVARALDPEHLLCIRDDDFGGQYADPLEVIAEMRAEVARLREAGADAERVGDAYLRMWKRAQDQADELREAATAVLREADRDTNAFIRLRAAIDTARRPAPGGE